MHMLVFNGGCLFATTIVSTVENEHAYARFRWWLLVCHIITSPPSKPSIRMLGFDGGLFFSSI